eukprot:13942_1
MTQKKRRTSKRKRDEIDGIVWDEEHNHLKYKLLCCGLLEHDEETIQHLKKYYYLFNINYNQTSLHSLNQNINRGDTYFFCGGEALKADGSSKCTKCIEGLKNINTFYHIFDRPNVKEICKFLDKAATKKCRPFDISASFDDNNNVSFIINVDKQNTNNRFVRWVVAGDKLQRFDDRNPVCWTSNEETPIDCVYLLKYFQKWIAYSIRFCPGITGIDWFDENNFGCNRDVVRWIDTSKIIIHKECVLKEKKSKRGSDKIVCSKCRSVKGSIGRMETKGTFNETPSKHTATKYLNAKQRDLKIDELKKENRELKIELNEVQKELNLLKKTFSVSVFKIMTTDSDIADIEGIHMVSIIKVDVSETYRQVD